MVDQLDLTRRSLIRNGAAVTTATGIAGLSGCLGEDTADGAAAWQTDELAEVPAGEHPELYEPTEADLDASESLAHLTWTGYDAENVQGPFRNKFNAQTNIDLFTDNAQAFNRLQAGEWEQLTNARLIWRGSLDLLRPT